MSEAPSSNSVNGASLQEYRKRRREIVAIVGLSLLFLLLTWVEYRLFDTSKELPFYHSIFFFGLVNFNIIILLLLLFLVFRNVVKGFVEKRGHWFGKSLRSKLIAAFVSFSVVPTVLMLLVSIVYINNSFDKWFSIKTTEVLKNSLEVTNAYYLSAKKKNYHFANQIAEQIKIAKNRSEIEKILLKSGRLFRLDAAEFYPAVLGERLFSTTEDNAFFELPPVSMDFLKKGIVQKIDASTIHHYEDGNLVRVIVPVRWQQSDGAVVVSSYIPMSLISRMDDIASAYEDLRHLDPIQHPLKSIYLIILILMTMVILLGATWFGIHLARQLAIPLDTLGKATIKVAHREYDRVEITSGSEEINQLVQSFNSMVRQLAQSEKEVLDANSSLNDTLGRLDEHSRYIEVILANVNTGVIAVDQNGIIRTFNRYAGQLLMVNPQQYLHHKVSAVLTSEQLEQLNETLMMMKKHQAAMLQKELQIQIRDRQIPLQVSITLLRDDKGKDLGTVLVFDDLTMMVNAQRAAAWKEVARRIAHEIKNPLTPIKLAAERLQKKFGEQVNDPSFSECTKMIIREADELKNMVNEFNQFARLPQIKPAKSSMQRVLLDVVNLYNNSHKNISFQHSISEDMPAFLFDAEQMKRAFINLVDNAVAAVSNTKMPQIAINGVFDSTLKIVRIEIMDNGCGIPRPMLRRIFEPYITMKEHGTGLGLAIVKRIIEDHNGFVRALPNGNEGTKIVVELPVTESKTYDVIVQSMPVTARPD